MPEAGQNVTYSADPIGIAMKRTLSFTTLLAVSCLFGSWLPCLARGEEPVDYNRDIRPLLSNTCYQCHGPDENERQADLRFDQQEAALAPLDSDGHAIVPGDSAASVLYQRITAEDEDEKMPPADSGKSLTADQISLIKRWIDEGAAWRGHWSFTAPERPAPPVVKAEDLVRNAIDRFIQIRAGQAGLKPSVEAAKETLIRRVTFDLTGLPPTLEELDAFLADESPEAYERVVDRLLKSPRYGEHMARHWLDAARYGDTHGLHLDNRRQIWPYRDWVIQAFSNNMPFDRFTIEQMSGDLLPDATIDQKVATGFGRCNVTTSEGGSIAEEYRVRYSVDRVETMGTVFLGLTLGCAVCHEHKFDPISQKEFYQLYAYFYNFAERPMDGNALLPPPVIEVPTAEQTKRRDELRDQMAALQTEIREQAAKVEYVEPESTSEAQLDERQEFVWIDDSLPPGAEGLGNGNPAWQFVSAPDHPVFSGKTSTVRTDTGLSQHFFQKANPQLVVGAGDTLFAYVYLDPKNPPKQVMLQFNDGTWEHRAYWGEDAIAWGKPGTPSRLAQGKLPETGKWVRLETEAAAVGLKPGTKLNGWAFTQFGGTVHWDKAGILTKTPQGSSYFDSQLAWEQFIQTGDKKSLPKPIQDILKVAREKRTPQQQKSLRTYFIENAYTKTRETFAPLKTKLAAAQAELKTLDGSVIKTLVMGDKPRDQWTPAYLLSRGQYDKPDKEQQVTPSIPVVFADVPKGSPDSRLGLAQWLVDRQNPLTARVTVNRFWQQLFGTGIVKTSEDFGSQGDWPSHPQLLDWLAVEFMESGWNVNHILKLMVMSHTYRQSPHVTPMHLEQDKDNRLLARGPRFRLDAEAIRDNALAISRLLSPRIGGASVRPYQPDGLWRAVGYSGSNTVQFQQDHGEALYRRSMYIFWKRTAPPPAMQIFDAPSREFCVMRRERTNTPGGALVLLNDIQFVEAARKFGERIMVEGGASLDQRFTFAFRSATARKPDADELRLLHDLYGKLLKRYQKDPAEAEKLLGVGESPRDEKLDVAELAAWTMIASTILNLDETITKG